MTARSDADAAPADAAGSCFGFAVSSTVPLRYLRRADGATDRVGVEEADGPDGDPGPVVLTWSPTPAKPLDARLHVARGGARYSFWIEGRTASGWYVVEPGAPRMTVPPSPDGLRREERLWGLPSILLFTALGDVSLHAAAVVVDGRALLLAAPSRFGKTTLAAAFAGAGWRLLAEDVVRVHHGPHGPVAFGGPAMLRLRRDVAERVAVERSEVLGVDDDRVHLRLPDEATGDARPIPIAGVVLLRASDDERIEAVTASDSLRELWALTFQVPTTDDRTRAFDGLARLAGDVPIWNVWRRMEYERLDAVVEDVAELARA